MYVLKVVAQVVLAAEAVLALARAPTDGAVVVLVAVHGAVVALQVSDALEACRQGAAVGEAGVGYVGSEGEGLVLRC